MSNNLNDIVKVNIDISSPAADSTSFDNLLILGQPPAITPVEPRPTVSAYADLTEVATAGYVTVGELADPVGIAARIAFSQNPKPSQIYVASIAKAAPIISAGDIKIITAENAVSKGIVGVDDELPTDLPRLQLSHSCRGAASVEVEIDKDDVLVFGAELPAEEYDDAVLQVCLGSSENEDANQMNLDSDDFAGTYKVTLTALDSEGRKTVIVQVITFDGASEYEHINGSFGVTPLVTDLIDTLTAATETSGWYVVCEAGIDENLFESIAEWTEAQRKMFAYTYLSKDDPVSDIYFRTYGICGLINEDDAPADVPQANSYLHVAMTAKCLSYDAGSETWAFKQLTSVNPSKFSYAMKKAISDNNSNYFAEYASRNITMNGKVRSGEWIDVIRGRDWLENDMQLRIFSLFLANPKIFFTNSGISLVQNEMIASLKAARDRGIVAEDEYDEDENLIVGFTVSVPNAASITAAQKATRILNDCKFSARLAGAIHAANISGSLNAG